MKQKSILIFGGTFDPIHIGHISLLNAGIKKINPTFALIMPTKIPPLKSMMPSASAKHRMDMIKLAFGKMPNVKISSYEISLPSHKPSYTYLTIRHLKQIYPNYKLYFLIGMDRLNDFKEWKNWQEILKNATLVVAGRDKQKPLYKNNIFLNFKEVPTSSSKLRIKPNPKFLPQYIVKYIADNGLYIANQIKPLMSKYRYDHTLRVVNSAIDFAHTPKEKLKAKIAASFHDVAKEFKPNQILKLVGKYDKSRFPTIHTLHGVASANYVKKYFNINDKEILTAIENHVIPKKNCSRLSKILYCADKLEPARTTKDIPNRTQLYNLAKKDINKAFKKVFDYISKLYIK